MERQQCVSPLLKQSWVTAAVALNCVGLGGVFGFTAVFFHQLHQLRQAGGGGGDGDALIISTTQESWILGLLSVSMLPGNFLAPLLTDRWCGRRGAHVAAAATMLLGWLYTALADSFTDLVISRALHGFAFGMLMSVRSVIVGEYSSPGSRGAFLTTLTLAQTFGIFFVHLVGSALSWQKAALIFSVFPFGALVITLYIPESPSFLATRGRTEECRAAFRWLRGTAEELELQRLLEAANKQTDNEETTGVKEIIAMFGRKEFYKPILVMAHGVSVNAFAGGPLIASYATIILSELLGSTDNVAFWMLVLDSQRLVFNILSVFVVRRFRRRTVLFWTLALCIASQISISAFLYAKSSGDQLCYQWIPLLLINVQYFSVGIGIMPVLGVLAGEVFPLQNRGVASSITMLFMAAAGFTNTKTFPGLLESLRLNGAYLIHSGFLVYCFVVLWFTLPETKGKTLQEIEDGFSGNPGAQSKRVARKDTRLSTVSLDCV